MLLKVCVNGARGPHEHPALPVTAETMAEAAVRALAAGADAVHLHVRGAGHAESLQPDDVARTVEAVRARCGTVPIGVTTGAWIEPDLDERLALIQDWILLPDFASVNLEEEGVFEVCRALIEKGVGVEAGIGAVDEVRRLAESGLARSCLRILIEPVEPDAGRAIAAVRAIDAALDCGRHHPAPADARLRGHDLARSRSRPGTRSRHPDRAGGHAAPAGRAGRRRQCRAGRGRENPRPVARRPGPRGSAASSGGAGSVSPGKREAGRKPRDTTRSLVPARLRGGRIAKLF
jgi:hypothetical protein